MAFGGRRAIGRRPARGFAMRDQMREVILTAFCEMPLVADPLRGVLAGVMRVEVVGV
jgi:hypothetical protein